MYKVRIKKACGGKTHMQDGGISEQPMEPSTSMGAVPREEANIEVEKGESAYGDINGDSYAELMFFGGKRHHSGGTPVNVPPGTFIFSDTKELKIKDKDLLEKFFNIKSPSKKGYTPAEITKQYKDFNKHMEVLKNPDSDQIATGTAYQMINNIQDKLGALALIQESMKGFPDGIPSFAESAMAGLGIDPAQLAQQMAPQQEQPQQGGVPMAKKGGLYKAQNGLNGVVGRNITPYVDDSDSYSTEHSFDDEYLKPWKRRYREYYNQDATTYEDLQEFIDIYQEQKKKLADAAKAEEDAKQANIKASSKYPWTNPYGQTYHGEGLGGDNTEEWKQMMEYDGSDYPEGWLAKSKLYTKAGTPYVIGKEGAEGIWEDFLEAYEFTSDDWNENVKRVQDMQTMLESIDVPNSLGMFAWGDQDKLQDLSTILGQRLDAAQEQHDKQPKIDQSALAMQNAKKYAALLRYDANYGITAKAKDKSQKMQMLAEAQGIEDYFKKHPNPYWQTKQTGSARGVTYTQTTDHYWTDFTNGLLYGSEVNQYAKDLGLNIDEVATDPIEAKENAKKMMIPKTPYSLQWDKIGSWKDFPVPSATKPASTTTGTSDGNTGTNYVTPEQDSIIGTLPVAEW
jgi:hypothetical protein